MNLEDIAKICHQANKSYCETIGDNSQLDWDQAPEWQRQSAIAGVRFCLKNPTAPPSANHDSWMKEKVEQGWVYGEAKDAEAKTHPCIVKYENLPPQQQAKDYLFKGIVGSIAYFQRGET